jgi:lysozyme
MQTSNDGLAFIKAEEGCVLHAYKDVAGVYTIGYGHTGPTVKDGMQITQAQADTLLGLDLRRFENTVEGCVHVTLHSYEFDALVSLAFNIGASAFANSTLVRHLNAGEWPAAAAQFCVWTKAGGVHQPALLKRRVRELLRFVGYA